ncbi:PQQ-dependent sugar dehydrogenase [Alteromonas sp. H39]|uniref:PQQ-dependent sugar dehydrogenase n=1 Tax=Alteromonas sp. H39 TaxID=3389876 RepID=UPI0039E1491A
MKVWLSLLTSLTFLSPFAATAQNNDSAKGYQIETIAEELNRPWAVVETPDRRWLITEMGGTLVTLYPDGTTVRTVVPLASLYVEGQGGLLDVALTQDFAMSGRVMLTYAKGNAECNRLAVVSATLTEEGALEDISPVLEVTPCKDTPVHFGGRLAVLNDGTWLVTTGDGFDYREQAQKLNSQLGKVLRFREDGEAPADNPFEDAPYVYTLGHRNPQGLIVDEESGTVYQQEHGPDGGDEINVLNAGENYGWPVVTLGVDYSGARISPFESYPGMQNPLYNWTPSIAPSSMVLYQQDTFAWLQNHLVISALKSQGLFAINLSERPLQSQRIFATINQRIRDVAADHQGNIVVLTDGSAASLLRLIPQSRLILSQSSSPLGWGRYGGV